MAGGFFIYVSDPSFDMTQLELLTGTSACGSGLLTARQPQGHQTSYVVASASKSMCSQQAVRRPHGLSWPNHMELLPPHYIGRSSHKPIRIQGGRTSIPLLDGKTVKMWSCFRIATCTHLCLYIYVHRLQTERNHTKLWVIKTTAVVLGAILVLFFPFS